MDNNLNKYDVIMNDFLQKEGELTDSQEEELGEWLKRCESEINQLQKRKFLVARILDYRNLIKQGKTFEEISKYLEEDEKIVEFAELFLKSNLQLKNTMFGYPANSKDDTATVEYLRFLEGKLPLINGCGDPNEQGNYKMDNKQIENKIIDLFCKNLNLDRKDYWGYITSGGTEGNFWGLREGFSKYEDGTLYYSEESHYSVNKFANQGNRQIYENIEIQTKDGIIDIEDLINKCRTNWEERKKPAILLLTWGTTKTGAIDNVEEIKKRLMELRIPHYIHLDAAFYGGIPKNQEEAPILDLSKLGVDSVSVSLHKYLGNPKVNGVIISNKYKTHKFIDYIGQEDSTYLGSRDFLPFSTYQRVKETFERSDPKEYCTNINLFIEQASKAGMCPERKGKGNIFVIKKPSDELCMKYQLATFEENNEEFAHIIITPGHKKEDIQNLVADLQNELGLDLGER